LKDLKFLNKAKSFFGTTTERREKILNHGLHELTRIKYRAEKRRARLGQANLWIFKSLRKRACTGLLKPIAHFATQMALLCAGIFGKKQWFAIGLQAGMCCEKASASPLASVFSTTHPAFAQRINTMIFGLPIRVYLGNPWLKCMISGWQNHWSGG